MAAAEMADLRSQGDGRSGSAGRACRVTYGPDPVTGGSYSCEPAIPEPPLQRHPALGLLLQARALSSGRTGVIAGLLGAPTAATQDVKRDEMAKFLSNAFALELGRLTPEAPAIPRVRIRLRVPMRYASLRPRLDPLLPAVEKPGRYIGLERNVMRKDLSPAR